MNYGNRLRNVVGQEGSYAYDGYGRRIQQVNTAGVINSFYDHAGQLVYQEDRDGTTHDYLYLQGRLVAIRDYNASGAATAMRYQHTDAQGSIIRQTDKTGAEIAGTGYIYDAWGKQIGGSVHDGPGYTGHVMDVSTGLTYMQQRYYDPDAMHFLSMDPVEANNAGGNLDRYWYANDNPYRYTDPDGRMIWTDWDRGKQGELLCQENRIACENALDTGGQAKAKQSSRPAGQCDAEECDEVRQTHATIIKNWGDGLENAGLFAGKFAALNFAGDGIGRLFGKLRGLGRFLGLSREDVSFGRNANQLFHTFRHVESAGLDRGMVQQTIQKDLRSSSSLIRPGEPFNQTITVGGTAGVPNPRDVSECIKRIRQADQPEARQQHSRQTCTRRDVPRQQRRADAARETGGGGRSPLHTLKGGPLALAQGDESGHQRQQATTRSHRAARYGEDNQ